MGKNLILTKSYRPLYRAVYKIHSDTFKRRFYYRPLYRAVYDYRLRRKIEMPENYRPLYRAVYGKDLRLSVASVKIIAHYIGLSTYIDDEDVEFIAHIIIAHYIGLSTMLLGKH